MRVHKDSVKAHRHNMQSQSTKSGSAQCQPVFILVRALVGDVVVEERHIKTRVVEEQI